MEATADNSKHPYTQLNCRLARTQIEVNLFFVLMHSQKKILKKSNTENKVTPGNGLPWHQALLWGKREIKLILFFAFFANYDTMPDPRLMFQSRALNIKAAYSKKARLIHCITF